MYLNFPDLYKKYKLNIKGVIHVGGHHGEEAKIYKQFGVPKAIFFEPVKENFNIMVKNIFDYESVNCALGSNNKLSEIYVEHENSGASSSILKPERHLEFYPYTIFDEKQFISVKTLDSFHLDGYNFMNIDVQGYELEVFRGSVGTLKNIDYLICEVNLVKHYENCPLINDIDSYLFLAGFIRVDTYFDHGLWGDAFYINKAILNKF